MTDYVSVPTPPHGQPTTLMLPSPVVIGPSRISLLTRFFVWASAFCLSAAVLVALVAVTSERNDLRAQLSCRAIANANVNQAITNEQITLADHSGAVGEFITLVIRGQASPTYLADLADIAVTIDGIDSQLGRIGSDLREAVIEQQKALSSC